MRSIPASPAYEHERRFPLFGTQVRLLIGEPLREGLPSAEAMGIQIEFFLRLLHRKLTRFDRRSELSALNAATTPHVLVGSTLATANAIRRVNFPLVRLSRSSSSRDASSGNKSRRLCLVRTRTGFTESPESNDTRRSSSRLGWA